jgi:hypothetical protein
MAFDPQPAADPHLRDLLLNFFIDGYTSEGLADWLRELGQDPKGTLQERKARVFAHTQYLRMPADGFPRQTRHYLSELDTEELVALCELLALPEHGTKDSLCRRIMREVGYREHWLPRSISRPIPETADLALFLAFYPIVRRGKYEKDFYPAIAEELEEVCGEGHVYEQLPIAHGSTLKVDFHVGHPQREGIGVEVKLPTSNADIQRSLGQIDQYLHRYGSDFILLLIPDFIGDASITFMTDQLAQKGVRTVTKPLD